MNINEMDNRSAMGLHDSYVPTIKDDIQHLYDKFRLFSKSDLIKIIENSHYSLLERYVVGQILATIGDSRILVFDPHMIDIPCADVEIGIHEEQINDILETFKHVGVKREWILKETPKFCVKIDKFRAGKYLITNQEFKEFLKDTQFDELPSSWEFGIYSEHKANHPVYTISFTAAEKYVEWLSYKTNRKFRLLSEFEWEYIASGNKHKEFPWGMYYKINMANTLETKFFSSTPVGIFLEGNSEFGISDIAGNVEEYVDSDYEPYFNGPIINDDLTATLGKYKVCRGGGFTRYADLARCSRRHGAYPKDLYVIGMRLAETI